jgi:hypothetical protein
VPAGSSALPMPNFRPIRRDLSPDLAMGSANGWRCSYCYVSLSSIHRSIYSKHIFHEGFKQTIMEGIHHSEFKENTILFVD